MGDGVLTMEQWQAVRREMRTWLQTRLKHEPRYAEMLAWGDSGRITSQLCADIDHSALLCRLLVDGKSPLPEPPPLSFSYPDYAAVEEHDA